MFNKDIWWTTIELWHKSQSLLDEDFRWLLHKNVRPKYTHRTLKFSYNVIHAKYLVKFVERSFWAASETWRKKVKYDPVTTTTDKSS